MESAFGEMLTNGGICLLCSYKVISRESS